MLIRFSVKNFRSIKERVDFSFEASSIEHLRENVMSTDTASGSKQLSLLKTAVVYGPNASGKSNLIKALSYMKSLVIRSNNFNKGDALPYEPFRLDENWLRFPSEFEIELILNKVTYLYGFAVHSNLVEKEYLYYYPNGRKALIFERHNTRNSVESNVSDYKFTTEKNKQEQFASMTSVNKLYLSVSTNLENKLTESVFNWFNNDLVIRSEDIKRSWEAYTSNLIKQDKEKEKVIAFLKGADFNISNITVKDAILDLPENIMEAFFKNDVIEKFKNESILEVNTMKWGIDKNGDSKAVSFKMDEESDGTNKFFELSGPFVDILMHGKCLIFDELDTKLHPTLLVFLVTLFNKNRTNAQLLFTAHNTVILDQKYLRRDQIYFTNLKEDYSTDLYSVYDFPDEKVSSNLSKRYLTGRYDALPFVDEASVINAMLEALDV